MFEHYDDFQSYGSGILDTDITSSSSLKHGCCPPTFFIIIVDHDWGWLNVSHGFAQQRG